MEPIVFPRANVQEQHESMPNVKLREYMLGPALRNQVPIPAPDRNVGSVKARLHRGLWIVDCPNGECSNAMAVTSVDPAFFCCVCGDGWYIVEFPENKAEIKAEVERRPVHGRGMIFANWQPGETMTSLEFETSLGGDVRKATIPELRAAAVTVGINRADALLPQELIGQIVAGGHVVTDAAILKARQFKLEVTAANEAEQEARLEAERAARAAEDEEAD